MEILFIVSLLAVMQFVVFGALVGRARSKSGIKAPATTGDATFERYFRVHYNTLEQLVGFFPGLWAFGLFIDAYIAAGIGVVYLIGRIIYARGYVADPAKRGPGMLLSAIPVHVLVLGGLGGAIWRIVG